MNALLQFHLSGADDEALGADLAFQVGASGPLAASGVDAAQRSIGAPGFGQDAQSLQSFSGLQEGFVRLG